MLATCIKFELNVLHKIKDFWNQQNKLTPIYLFAKMDCATGLEDECDTVLEFYQSGREYNLSITNQIFTINKGNATVESLIVKLISLSDLYNFGFPRLRSSSPLRWKPMKNLHNAPVSLRQRCDFWIFHRSQYVCNLF